MATVTLKGNEIKTIGDLPQVGSDAPDFTLVKDDLTEVSLSHYAGKRLVLNIFPAVDTATCASSVRVFNQKALSLPNTTVLCVSADLPFSLSRFCNQEAIHNVETGSSFRSSFGKDYGITFTTGVLKGLLSRCVIVIDDVGKVLYNEQVAETVDEPDYEAVLAVLTQH